MGEWAIVLSSTTPNQLADRLAFLQSVGSAGNAVHRRPRARTAPTWSTPRPPLTAARASGRRQARAAAAIALTAVSSKAMMARAAEQQVDAVVAAREAAFEAAKKAALEDKRQYQVLVAQSGALGSRIVELAAELRQGPEPAAGHRKVGAARDRAVTSPYGPRFHPILHYVKVHTGTDFGAGDGIVYAADDGVVLFTEFNTAYGNMTVIDHGKVGGLRITTLYAHQSAVGVKPGDRVVKGQAIGVIGSTGYSTGPHLHFEVRIDGEPLDPAPFLEDAKLPTAAPGRRARARPARLERDLSGSGSFVTVSPWQRREHASAPYRARVGRCCRPCGSRCRGRYGGQRPGRPRRPAPERHPAALGLRPAAPPADLRAGPERVSASPLRRRPCPARPRCPAAAVAAAPAPAPTAARRGTGGTGGAAGPGGGAAAPGAADGATRAARQKAAKRQVDATPMIAGTAAADASSTTSPAPSSTPPASRSWRRTRASPRSPGRSR